MSCPKTGQVSVAVLQVSREHLIFSFWLMLKHKRTDHPDVVTVWAKWKNNRAAQQWIKKPREKKWESLLDTMLLLLSHFSRVRLCMTPQTAAHQAPPSLGFSRQEHWSGLPFPSPMHESEKWKWSRSVVSDSSQPHGLQPTMLLHPWDFPGKSTGVGCHCLLRLDNIDPGNLWDTCPGLPGLRTFMLIKEESPIVQAQAAAVSWPILCPGLEANVAPTSSLPLSCLPFFI